MMARAQDAQKNRAGDPHAHIEQEHIGSERLRKPLYLNATHVKYVDAEGPALEVRLDDRTTAHFPIARLSRILVLGSVTFSGEAITLILQAGLSVTFLDARGNAPGQYPTLLGHMLSAIPLPDDSLAQRLQDLHAAGQLAEALENWRLSRLRAALLHELGPHLGWLKDLRARNIRQRTASIIWRNTGLKWLPVVQRMRPLLRALVVEKLQAAGITPRWLDPGPLLPDVAAVILNVAEVGLWRIGLVLRKPPKLDSERSLIALFERHHRRLEKQVDALVNDLARHLFEIPIRFGETP